MDIKEFRKELLEDVRSTAAAYGEGTSTAFVNIMADNLVNSEVISDFISAFYMGHGIRNRKIRIDGYALDEFDNTLNLIVSDYSANEEGTILTRKEAEQIFLWPLRFIDEIYKNNLSQRVEISTSAADLIDLVVRNKGKISKYRILLFTDRYMSGRIESFEFGEYDGIPVEYQIWDIERVFKIFQAESGRESIEINFTSFVPKGIPCLEASNEGIEDYRCFLCVIPGELLADIYDYYGAQLLEGNVRSFLSTKVAVNKKIRQTILTEPKMFFAFNNGVSATATSVTVENKPEGKFITYVRDFQIINGGQTTASLSNARFRDKADLSKITLQMKLTEVNEDIDETQGLLQKISRSSNSQNKVSDADFFSTHPFHIRMEQISRRVYAPAIGGAQHDTHWFYERARGQYLQAQMRMKKSEKDRFLLQNPKSQLVSKTDLAKARNSWRCLPHIVSKGAQRNFTEYAEWIDKEWSTSSENFNERYFQESIALYILFKHVEKLVPNQPWYEKGYRANIVTYSIALFAHLLKKQYNNYTLDLQIIWNKQAVSDVISNQMVRITKRVYESITDPNRGNANVTQWCKQEACWKGIAELDILLDKEIKSVLLDKKEFKSEIRQAARDQKVITGIEAQTEVVNKGAEYWSNLYDFIINKRVATLQEMQSLKIACKLPLKLPNSIQSQLLLSLVEKAKLEGWKEI
ncbi:AIPR family protein [Lederbergia panacisoli]|uniref:AIPR family protein n=1 Tax=Lederbergia panacisoli TaxID=1255251 RepID=UPI00214AE96D|nr:AIPR family protein [Lederbergia panacisoli]MCR2823318.1 AIPR family protein [Lederbergia panacisoli]